MTGHTTPTIPAILADYRPAIDAALKDALDRPGQAYRVLRYAMGWESADGEPISAQTGKAVRPSLCLLACEMVGGNATSALPAAVSLELIHNFSLIHDDIQDRDESRHGRPSVWKTWDEAKALDAGNTMRVEADLAVQRLTAVGVQVATAVEVATVINEVFLEVVQGQYLDVSFEQRRDVGLSDYFQMISMKTGALIRTSLMLGAMLGEAEPQTVRAFTEFGRALGAVFQITDDVLGIWGDEESTGKPVGSDIRRKKKSLPILFAMSKSRGTALRRMREIYAQDSVSGPDVAAVLEIMDDLETRRYAGAVADRHRGEALDALSAAELEPEILKSAEEIAQFLLTRSF